MKKNRNYYTAEGPYSNWHTLLLIMKISIFLFFFGLMNLAAVPGYSQNSKISLKMKDASIENVLSKIEEVSEYYFLYNHDLIDVQRKIDIEVNRKPVKEILQKIFTNDVRFINSDHQIVIVPHEESPESGSKVQQRIITGTVTDKDGTPLPGVNVVVTGSIIGTLTDVSGKYSIEIPQGVNSLTFSFIGMRTQEIVIGTLPKIDVIMDESAVGLDEVVVVGYGTMKKSDLTGSLSQVKVKDQILELPNVSIGQALQGTVAGLNVGIVEKAGEEPNITIRGINTLSEDQSDYAPLLVVDGAIYRGNLIDINPSDIESIEVLKDVSSASIYGSQSANGVILISTKKGVISEKPVISFSSQFTMQVPSNKMVPMNGEELEKFILDALWDKGSRLGPDYLQPNPNFSISPYLFTPQIREGYANGVENEWFGMLTGNGYIKTSNLDIRGRNQGFGYFISAGLNNTKGFVKNDTYKRYNLRINLDSKINDWLNLGIESFLTSSDYSGVEPDYTVSDNSIFTMQPWAPVYDSEGNYELNPSGYNIGINPFLIIQQEDEDKRFNVFGNIHTDIKLPFLEGFNYRINYSQNYLTSFNNRFDPWGAEFTGYGYKNSSVSYVWSLDNIFNYTKAFRNMHSINLTFVYGLDNYKISNTDASAQNFTNKTLGFNSLEAGNPTLFLLNSGAEEESSVYSMVRMSYDFRKKYLFTGTIRRDGFSGFGVENKIGIFPSIAFAWVPSDEDFLKELKKTIYVKLRASYGSTGRRGVKRYDTKDVVSLTPQVVFGDGEMATMGQWISKMANDKLGWETTTGLNLGTDLAVLNSRFSGSFEYYSTNTTNILYFVQLPQMTGFEGIVTNIGKVHNNGIEVSLSGNIVKKSQFSWDASFNLSRNRNKIVSILGVDSDGTEQDLVANLLFIGQPKNVIYDYEITGEMWQISDQLEGNIPTGFLPGTYKIVDQNNDGKFSATDDRKILGYQDPSYRFGIINTLRFKSFSMYCFINSIQGGKDYYKAFAGPGVAWRDFQEITHKNGPKGAWDYWMPENPNAKYTRLDGGGSYRGRVYDQRNFIRLQDITLSYTFNKNLINKLALRNLKAFISGKNLVTLTKWEGWDPETGRGINPGLPVMKSYSLGLNVEF